MTDLVWTLPAAEQTARWAENAGGGGGGGGSQDLAQVLAEGGDPGGNPITGALAISPTDPDITSFQITQADGAQPFAATFKTGDFTGENYVLVRADGAIEQEVAADAAVPAYTLIQAGGAYPTVYAISAAGTVTTDGGVIFPSADPHVAGAWWDNAGTLTRSSG